jgi:Stress up-regulated Nod 19
VNRHVLILLAVITALLAWSPVASAEETTTTVRYGPYTIPAGTMTNPGMVHNKLELAVRRPCSDCFITGFTPELVDLAGNPVPKAMDGAMLHHAVWTSQWRSDATCSGTWLGLAGQRFFATGNERTPIEFPSGYGYRLRWYDSWNMLVDLMNHSADEKTVYVQVTFKTRPSWESVNSVRPVWLDVDQCGDSEYSIPAGYSDTHWDWKVNVPGKVVAALGHVHGHGIAVEATNRSGRKSICRSEATLDPNSVHNVLAMSTCPPQPIKWSELDTGQTVRLHSEYQSSHAADDVMGIMLMYIDPA